ncbi:hypothetical protein MKW92_049345 [Papaver armeniacum]|nr:hypothetical protein MKW92_049345 [Papaver armeniacum]
MNPDTTKVVGQISKCTIRPHQVMEESKQPTYLTPWDLSLFNFQYIQKGLLFRKPAPSLEDPTPTITFIHQLRHSLSMTLTHFYPLSGRMVTKKQDNPPFYGIYVDSSNDSVGAEFIHAAVDITMMDILSPTDVPLIVQSFFALEGAICHDGHTEPLLVVQVTELLDGIFVGCTFNHVLGDGTSYWNFFHAFAEIARNLRKASKQAGDQHIDGNISRLPITKRWLLEENGDPFLINLPFSHNKEFVEDRYERPLLRERMFHFTAESLAKLKAKANEEFCGTTTVGELLEHGIGWAALLLHEAIKEHTDEKIRGVREEWMKKPRIYQTRPLFDPASLMMGSSPRFDVYGCDFGLGTALAARSGFNNNFDGKVSSYRGLTGIGSVLLEVCLPPESMSALESDEEFMDAVSPHEIHLQHLAHV